MEKEDCSLRTRMPRASGVLKHLEQTCYLPCLAGRSLWGDLSGVCGLGFWGEVKLISSSVWMASKEWIPLH